MHSCLCGDCSIRVHDCSEDFLMCFHFKGIRCFQLSVVHLLQREFPARVYTCNLHCKHVMERIAIAGALEDTEKGKISWSETIVIQLRH